MNTLKNTLMLRAIDDRCQLFESSLSRIWQHINASKERSFGILTSWKQSKTRKQNVEDFNELKSAIRNAGYGFIVVKGHWKECQDPDVSYDDCAEENLVDAIEPSLVVIGAKLKELTSLAFGKFNQDAIVYSGEETDGNLHLVFKDMTVKYLGEFKPQSLGQAYTELKKTKHGSPKYFKLEGLEYKPAGFIEALVEQEVNKLFKN